MRIGDRLFQLALFALAAGGCLVTFDDFPVSDGPDAHAGASGRGGSAGSSSGGVAAEGGSTGGAATGGSSTDGSSTGGSSIGGTSTGGTSTGGTSTGGTSTGGSATGGTGTGGTATGGTGTGGSSGTSGRGGTSGTGGSCGDTTSSEDNCGRCGHHCCGGDCVGGTCQPLEIYPASTGATGAPFEIAVNDSRVFFSVAGSGTEKASVRQVGLTGGGYSSFVWLRKQITGLAADSAHLLISGAESFTDNSGYIETRPLSGGTAGVIAASQGFPTELILDGNYVYWRSAQSMISRRLKAGGGAIEPVGPAVTGLGARLAVRNGVVYYFGNSQISKINGDGSGAALLASNQGGVAAIAANGGYVFWSVPGADVIRRVSTGGGTASDYVSGQSGADFVAADDSFVYWIAPGAGALRASRAGQTTGSAMNLALNLVNPRKFALDGSCIYIPTGGGKVFRVAKP